MFRKRMILLMLLVGIAVAGSSVFAQSDSAQPPSLPMYLLTIRGTLATETLDAARELHNATAGTAENIAAARSLGDLSHMVYTPMMPAESGAGEILFLDIWNSLDGLNTFFANPQVQEQGGQIFSERDPVVWAAAEGYFSYNFPAPYGQNDRFVAMVRGTVASREEAMSIHNAIVLGGVNAARMAGDLSHDVYFRVAEPGSPEALEMLVIDVWMNGAGMNEFYQNPDFVSGIQQLFTSAPTVSIWTQTLGDWVEW